MLIHTRRKALAQGPILRKVIREELQTLSQ